MDKLVKTIAFNRVDTAGAQRELPKTAIEAAVKAAKKYKVAKKVAEAAPLVKKNDVVASPAEGRYAKKKPTAKKVAATVACADLR